MAKSYYSMILDHWADEVWACIRSFADYAWAGVESETIIEDGKLGDQVGAVRRVQVGDKVIRQRLLVHSDLERSYTYAYLGAMPVPVSNYVATLSVTPVIETGKAFVQWAATFDCAVDECERWSHFFAHDGFAKWLGSLRDFMAEIVPA